MRIEMYTVNGDSQISSGSIIPSFSDISNKELIERFISTHPEIKEERIRKSSELSAFTSEDFGPQRWSLEGDRLYQTDSEGIWVNNYGEVFYEEWDDILSYPFEAINLKPARKELNSSEQSWMAAHEHLLEPEISDEREEELISAEFSEDIEVRTNFEPSTERTELPKELVNFWGLAKSRSSVIFKAIRYSRKNAISMVMKVKDLLTEDELEWVREFLADKEITLPWKARKHLDNRFGGKSIQGFYGFPVSKDWKPLYCRLDAGIGVKIEDIRLGETKISLLGGTKGVTHNYTRIIKCLGMFYIMKGLSYGEFSSIVSRLREPSVIEAHIHIYPAQPQYGLKEGMVYCMIIQDGEIKSTYEKRSFDNAALWHIAQEAAKRAEKNGWIPKVVDMNRFWLNKFNTAPRYIKVRTLWNNPQDYFNKVKNIVK